MDRAQFSVPEELAGKALDGVLRALAKVTWGQARTWIQRGKVRVDGKVVVKHEHRVRAGQTLELNPSAPRPREFEPLDRAAILYVDTHVVVVNKPAGISTVPFDDKERGTLDQLVAALLPRARGKGPPESLGVVQRLDKETSGVLVFARTFSAKKGLSGQLRARSMHRRYVALVHGQLGTRTFQTHIAKNRGDSLRGTSRFGREGQIAITHVEALETFSNATLVACRLETGRTHQIRIHTAEANHPLLGERVYVRDYQGGWLPAPRPMLHALELGFVHPVREEYVEFSTPPPEDFETTLQALRAGALQPKASTPRR